MSANEIIAIVLWIFIAILTIIFGIYLFSYFKVKQYHNKLKSELEIYNEYQKKYSNYTYEYLVKYIGNNNPNIKNYELKKLSNKWENKQKKWKEMLNNASQLSYTLFVFKFSKLIKKINKIQIGMKNFGEEIDKNILTNNNDNSKNLSSMVIALNESLEEFYNYFITQKIYDPDNFKIIHDYKNKINSQMQNAKSLDNNPTNIKFIELMNVYADKLINYYQFFLTINQFISLENKISQLIKKENYSSDFSIQLQRHANMFNKICNDISSVDKNKINKTWLFIDEMNNKLNNINMSIELNKWLKDNYLKINTMLKFIVKIHNLYQELKKSNNKIFSAIDINDWYSLCEEIFTDFNEINKIKNSPHVIEDKQQMLINHYTKILLNIDLWIIKSQQICVDINSQYNYQLLINNQKINLMQTVKFFKENNIDTKTDLSSLMQKFDSVHFPYSKKDKEIIDEISENIIQICIQYDKNQSYITISKELKKYQNLDTNPKLVNISKHLNKLYEEQKYFEYIQEYLATFK